MVWRRLQALAPYLVLGVLLVVALALFGPRLSHHLHDIAAWVMGLGPWGPPAFVVVFAAATSLFVPESLFGIAAGLVFGIPRGLLILAIASAVAAGLQLMLARTLLRPRVDRLIGARPMLGAVAQAVRRDGWRLQFLVRMTPLNSAAVSYALGAGGVRTGPFFGALSGLLLHLFLEVYAGYTSRHVARMAGRTHAILQGHDAVVLGGILVSLVGVVMISNRARRAVLAELR